MEKALINWNKAAVTEQILHTQEEGEENNLYGHLSRSSAQPRLEIDLWYRYLPYNNSELGMRLAGYSLRSTSPAELYFLGTIVQLIVM